MRKNLAVLMIVAAAIALAAFAAEAPVPVPNTDDTSVAVELEPDAQGENACVETAKDDVLATDEFVATPAAPGGCKACKGRTWCTCSYQGKPRISCNPCCYQGALDPFPICFD